jgi:hypothetical protein
MKVMRTKWLLAAVALASFWSPLSDAQLLKIDINGQTGRSDTGGATNVPSGFYRVGLVP